KPVEDAVQDLINRFSFLFTLVDDLRCPGMREDDVVDEGAGGRLAAFRKPEARDHGGVIGSPHSVDEARLLRYGHVAGGRTPDQGKPRLERVGRHLGGADRRPERADAAGVRVDDRHRHRRTLFQAKVLRRLVRKAGPNGFTHRPYALPDPRVLLVHEIAKTNPTPERVAPP